MRKTCIFALLLMFAGPARASVLIDDFTTGAFSNDYLILATLITHFDSQPGSMLGGKRDTQFQALTIGNGPPVGHFAVGGGLAASVPGNSFMEVRLEYTPAGADLRREDRIELDFSSSSHPMLVGLDILSPNGVSRVEMPIAASNAPFKAYLPFAGMLPIGGAGTSADLADVTGIRLFFRGSLQSARQSLGLTTIRAVPEPATWMSLALGVLCVGVVMMRRNSPPKCAADRIRPMQKA